MMLYQSIEKGTVLITDNDSDHIAIENVYNSKLIRLAIFAKGSCRDDAAVVEIPTHWLMKAILEAIDVT